VPKPASVSARQPKATRTYQVVEVTDLSGGLDLRRSPTLLNPDRARVLKNYALSTPGELVVRPGYLQFSTTNLGSSKYQGGRRIYLADTQFTLTAWGGEVRRPPDGAAHSSVVEFSTISETNPVYFPYDRVLVAVMDGANRPFKSTGDTTWSRMGIDAPAGQSTASSVSNGSLSASDFEFTFAYKDRGTGHLSNISTVLTTRSLGATGAIHLECPNSSDQQVDAIVVYARNKTAGEEVLRKASSGPISSGNPSSTIRVTSSGWSSNDEAPTNHNVPGPHRFAVPWKNRWWAPSSTVGNRLHFTELFQNQSWPTLFFLDLPFERGDEIAAVVPQGDTLLVFGQSKVYLIIGQTSLDFEVKPSAGAQAGALGPRAVAAIEYGIVHASADGVFIFDGASDKYLSFDIEPGWRDLVRSASAADLALVALEYHFPYKELRIAVPRLFPRAAPGEWVLDLNRTRESGVPAWTDTDRSIGGYILWDGDEPTVGNRGRLLSWDSTTGRLFEESTGTTANSSNMTAEYEGPHLAMGLHRARFIDLHGEYEPHGGALTVEVVTDAGSQGQQSINIGAGIATYGSGSTYGQSVYGGSGRRKFYTPLPLGAEGRAVWLKTSYSGQESFKLFTYALGTVPESSPRQFSE
jgi:hypothetical protein